MDPTAMGRSENESTQSTEQVAARKKLVPKAKRRGATAATAASLPLPTYAPPAEPATPSSTGPIFQHGVMFSSSQVNQTEDDISDADDVSEPRQSRQPVWPVRRSVFDDPTLFDQRVRSVGAEREVGSGVDTAADLEETLPAEAAPQAGLDLAESEMTTATTISPMRTSGNPAAHQSDAASQQEAGPSAHEAEFEALLNAALDEAELGMMAEAVSPTMTPGGRVPGLFDGSRPSPQSAPVPTGSETPTYPGPSSPSAGSLNWGEMDLFGEPFDLESALADPIVREIWENAAPTPLFRPESPDQERTHRAASDHPALEQERTSARSETDQIQAVLEGELQAAITDLKAQVQAKDEGYRHLSQQNGALQSRLNEALEDLRVQASKTAAAEEVAQQARAEATMMSEHLLSEQRRMTSVTAHQEQIVVAAREESRNQLAALQADLARAGKDQAARESAYAAELFHREKAIADLQTRLSLMETQTRILTAEKEELARAKTEAVEAKERETKGRQDAEAELGKALDQVGHLVDQLSARDAALVAVRAELQEREDDLVWAEYARRGVGEDLGQTRAADEASRATGKAPATRQATTFADENANAQELHDQVERLEGELVPSTGLGGQEQEKGDNSPTQEPSIQVGLANVFPVAGSPALGLQWTLSSRLRPDCRHRGRTHSVDEDCDESEDPADDEENEASPDEEEEDSWEDCRETGSNDPSSSWPLLDELDALVRRLTIGGGFGLVVSPELNASCVEFEREIGELAQPECGSRATELPQGAPKAKSASALNEDASQVTGPHRSTEEVAEAVVGAESGVVLPHRLQTREQGESATELGVVPPKARLEDEVDTAGQEDVAGEATETSPEKEEEEGDWEGEQAAAAEDANAGLVRVYSPPHSSTRATLPDGGWSPPPRAGEWMAPRRRRLEGVRTSGGRRIGGPDESSAVGPSWRDLCRSCGRARGAQGGPPLSGPVLVGPVSTITDSQDAEGSGATPSLRDRTVGASPVQEEEERVATPIPEEGVSAGPSSSGLMGWAVDAYRWCPLLWMLLVFCLFLSFGKWMERWAASEEARAWREANTMPSPCGLLDPSAWPTWPTQDDG